MEEKIYLIAGVNFKLKDFDDYTPNEEKKIKQLFNLSDEDNSIQLNSKDNNSVFPLLLESMDNAVDISKFDFDNMKNKEIREVMTDWIASRAFFIQNGPNVLRSLLTKKLSLILNIDQSTEKQESTSQN